MRAVLQRVSSAHVDIANERVGAIDRGILIFLGIVPHDTEADAEWLAAKITALPDVFSVISILPRSSCRLRSFWRRYAGQPRQ